MIQKLLSQVLVLLLLWPIQSIAKAAPPPPLLAKPNCRSSCGNNVTIPFPFGIGPACYLDNSYAVECQSDKPLLTSFGNLELLGISPERSTVQVIQPVIFSCQGRTTEEIFSIPENLPFYFSYDYNYFFGVGCNSLAVMFSAYHDNTVLGACFSVCNQKNKTEDNKYCYNGIECCQSGFPSNLKRLNISVTSSSHQQDCNYAFLVDLDTYDDNFNSSKDVRNWEQVPVALDWRIPNSSYDKLALSKSSTFGSTFNCDTDVNGLVRCYCNQGYEGNPYLSQGCQDIDDCKRPNICKSNMVCQNEAGSYTCVPIKKLKIFGIILDISAGMGVLFLVSGASWLSIVIRRRMKRKEKNFKRNGGLLLQQQLNSLDGSVDRCKIFNSNELEKATDHFNVNRVLGQGGQGTVYKGMLPDGRIIAVKKSKVVGKAKLEEFINEVVILSQINHRNVVKLLGCCLETEVPLLVYEFIPNGTLFHYLHHENEELPFTWDVRLRIATEVAEALSYLHSAAYLPVYHRDIKSTNILLDEKYRAKIADFGTSRSIAIGQTHISTKVQGTFGYLDPEYYTSSQFTEKSDVYSFGVVLVELLTGQKPVLSIWVEEGRNLATYFVIAMEENHLFDILDPQVREIGKEEEIMTVAKVAKRCLDRKGKERPTMKEVAMELERLRASENSNIVQKQHEEVKTVRSEAVINLRDISSTSTGSTFVTLSV